MFTHGNVDSVYLDFGFCLLILLPKYAIYEDETCIALQQQI